MAESTQVPDSSVMVPRHLAVVMDGNGRWARHRGLPRRAGHRAGVPVTRQLVESCSRYGIEVLTLFAFSSENWARPDAEVSYLMELFLRTLDRELSRLHENNLQLHFVGEIDSFPVALRRRMRDAEQLTRANTGMRLVLAMGYGGRWDIVQGVRRLAYKVREGMIDPEGIEAADLAGELSLGELPEPDLFLRTGGERRISNFLLWHLAYTELYFTDTLWPDFDDAQLDAALRWFASRRRRYGRTDEQVYTPSRHA